MKCSKPYVEGGDLVFDITSLTSFYQCHAGCTTIEDEIYRLLSRRCANTSHAFLLSILVITDVKIWEVFLVSLKPGLYFGSIALNTSFGNSVYISNATSKWFKKKKRFNKMKQIKHQANFRRITNFESVQSVFQRLADMLGKILVLL